MKNTEINNNTLTIKENEEEKVMKGYQLQKFTDEDSFYENTEALYWAREKFVDDLHRLLFEEDMDTIVNCYDDVIGIKDVFKARLAIMQYVTEYMTTARAWRMIKCYEFSNYITMYTRGEEFLEQSSMGYSYNGYKYRIIERSALETAASIVKLLKDMTKRATFSPYGKYKIVKMPYKAFKEKFVKEHMVKTGKYDSETKEIEVFIPEEYNKSTSEWIHEFDFADLIKILDEIEVKIQEENVMKNTEENTGRKEQEEKLREEFRDYPHIYDDLIRLESENTVDDAIESIAEETRNCNDDEQKEIIARAVLHLYIDDLEYYRIIVEEAIDCGNLEHDSLIDSILSNINKNSKTIHTMWLELGGCVDDERVIKEERTMLEIIRKLRSKRMEKLTADETVSKAGMCTVKEYDISEDCQEFMKQADCIVSSPPCNLTTLRRQYNEAGIKYTDDTYEPFVKNFFRHIDAIKPELLYIKVYPSNKNAFIKECESRFKHVCIDNSYYYRCKKNLCWIIRCGNTEEAPGPDREIDAAAYIRWVCKNVECTCIADPCIGTGIVGINANRYEKKFVGTELNRKKIEALINAVTEYEKKQAEKEKKKMMKKRERGRQTFSK